MLNIDELGARVSCLRGEYIVVLTDIKELYIASPKNRKSITMIETIIADRRDPPPPFIIAPRQKIIDNWVHENLIRKERIAATLTSYTNNNIAMQYLDHLIKHTHARLNKL